MTYDIYPLLMLSIAVIIFPYGSFIGLFGCTIYKNVPVILSLNSLIFVTMVQSQSTLFPNPHFFYCLTVIMVKLIFLE